MDAKQAIQVAVQHHRVGQLAAAKEIYQEILKENPAHADAMHLLGVLEVQTGGFATAVDLIRQAISVSPSLASIPQTHSNLATALQRLGRLEESIAEHKEAVRLNPQLGEFRRGLGETLLEAGRFEESIECFRSIIGTPSGKDVDYLHLANALSATGKLDEAIGFYHQAIAANPNLIEAQSNLGNVLQAAGRSDEAVVVLERAAQLQPNNAEVQNNLGNAYCNKGNLDEAVAGFQRAIHLKPDLARAHNNLGTALKDMGQLEESIASYRKAIQIDPRYVRAHSNLLYAFHFHDGSNPAGILEEHRRWNVVHAQPLVKSSPQHANDRDPDRPLRIGYVSPDFRLHPVGRFLLPILRHHDRDRFIACCYSDVVRPDQFTESFRKEASHWRDTFGLSDERLAQIVKEDQIDLLFDLTMHMAGSRMLLFALKPAPVQVSYLAYCSTTGLDAMDFRLSDPYLDPPGENDAFYSERSVRLAETYWCYEPPVADLEISSLPALSAGHVTFGCLNNFSKVSQSAWEIWLKLLETVPGSKLILHAREGSHRQRLLEDLESHGVDPQRLTFFPNLSLSDYLKLYDRIDIGLDPFPCNGGTTTCDALWMGVPVVTLAGNSAIGRGGVSVLSNVGLPEMIARTPEQYVRIASDLASNLTRLAELRGMLRLRMRQSPLMDAARFAHHFEAACRRMWGDWCLGNRV